MLISSRVVVDGYDLTPYIAKNGIKWSRNDLDGPNTGRNLDGILIRDRVAIKIKLEITCRPLTYDELQFVYQAILPEFFTVVYDDPLFGNTSKIMYSNNVRGEPLLVDSDGVELWDNVTFPMIER